jgi:monofunctional biosynthetic peptidoglycan transglycosylase
MRILPRRPGPTHSFPYRFAWWVAMAVIWFVLLSFGWALLYRVVPAPVTATMVMDPNGFTKEWTPISRINRAMVDSVIAGEDARFCQHHGFDGDGIAYALRRDMTGGKLRGGSTISQQTAKNVFLWQGTGWTRYLRKVLETWFTIVIETAWPKRRIMEMYLNVAETGIGTYGVEAASQRYFGVSAARLSPSQAGRIAAALPSPKKRAVIDPSGFTRRHGNSIAKRSGVVRNGDLDGCVYP